MGTIFIIVALTVLVLNSIIMRSKTPWWRNPAALFRPEEPEAPAPAPDPADRDPRRAADWVTAAQARAAEMSRNPMVAAPVAAVPVAVAPVVAAPAAEERRAVDPRELAPRPPAEAPPAVRALSEARGVAYARPATHDDEATTEVFGRIRDDDEAPTQMLERIPAGYPDAHSMR